MFAILAYEYLHSLLMLWPGQKTPDVIRLLQIGERPPIEETIPQSIRSLISDCWKMNAAQRPSFSEIHQRLILIRKNENFGQ